jgi:hypothetical protein
VGADELVEVDELE